MGIELRFALPGNAQAKIAERVYATLSRSVDDGPEFKGAHAGHQPGASPSQKVTPVPVELAKAILTREIGRYNRETGRKNQGAKGRSYDRVLRDGLVQRDQLGRPVRRPSARQLYLAGLVWKPVTVDRNTQITLNGWAYGGPETQEALAPYRRGGSRNLTGGTQILLGRDPDNFNVPAMAYDADGNFICEDIQPVKRGAYDSADGIREASRNRKAARDATKAAEVANNYLDDEAYQVAFAALDAAAKADDMPPPKRKVQGARFGGPLKAPKPKPGTDEDLSRVIEDFDRVTGFDPLRVLSGQ